MLTVYGIETMFPASCVPPSTALQQCLPFTVLKLPRWPTHPSTKEVATVLTVYGIETVRYIPHMGTSKRVATVLTVYGIETRVLYNRLHCLSIVATVLTVYGIETVSG